MITQISIEKTNTTAMEAAKFQTMIERAAAEKGFYILSLMTRQGPEGFSLSFDVEGEPKSLEVIASIARKAPATRNTRFAIAA